MSRAEARSEPGWSRTTATQLRRLLLCPLSYGFGLHDGSRTRLGEIGRNRTGTHPGHNRALCPVKLQPPCSSRGGLARSRTSISGISPRRSYRISYQTRLVEEGRPRGPLVETAGIEPATSCMRRRRSPNVSYIPKAFLPEVKAQTGTISVTVSASSYSRAG